MTVKLTRARPIAILLVLSLLLSMVPASVFAGTTAPAIDIKVVNIDKTSFSVAWMSGASEVGQVRYGTSPDALNKTISESTPRNAHLLKISSLSEDTTYYFEVVSGGTVYRNNGAPYTAKTAFNTDRFAFPPSPDRASGVVYMPDEITPASGALVYVTVRDADNLGSPGESTILAVITGSTGSWYVGLEDARPANGEDWFIYSKDGGDIVHIEVIHPAGKAAADVDTANQSTYKAVPNIILLDDVPPSITIASPYNGSSVNSNTPVLNYAILHGTVTSILVDGNPVETRNGEQLDTLADGNHTITVEASSRAGITNTASSTFTIDTEAPKVSITSPADGALTNNATPKLSYTVDDPTATVVVKVDGVAVDTRDGESLAKLSDGNHTITVEATDKAKNTGSATSTFSVDTVSPSVTITSPAAGLTNNNILALSYEVDDPDAEVVVKVDGAAVDTRNGESLAKLSDGNHTITVEATDKAGNTGSDEVAVTVDTTAPTVVADPPGGLYNQTKSVQLVASEDAIIYYTVDETTPTIESTVCSSSIDILESAMLKFMAIDVAGNQSVIYTEVYTIDMVAPIVEIISPADGILTNDATPKLSYTVDDPDAEVVVKVDGVAVDTRDSENLAKLSDGNHTITVEATDKAGNTGSASVSINVDTTPPVEPQFKYVTNPVNGYNKEVFEIIGASEPGATVKLNIYDDYEESYDSTETTVNEKGEFSVTLDISPLADGTIRINAIATDAAGNASEWSSSSVLKDTIAPEPAVADPAGPVNIANQGSFEVTGTAEPGATVWVDFYDDKKGGLVLFKEVLAGPDGAFSSSGDVSSLADGPLHISIVAIDYAGNPSEPSWHTITKDTVPPAIDITSPNALTNDATPLLSYSVTGGIVTAVKVDGKKVTTRDGQELAELPDGEHIVKVVAVDEAGNTGTATLTFTVDTVAPSIPQPTITALSGNRLKVSWGASTDSSGIDYYQVTFNGEKSTNMAETADLSYIFAVMPNAAYTASVKAYDNAGNFSEDGTSTASLNPSPAVDTPAKDNVVVTLTPSENKSPVTVLFDSVTTSGETSVTVSSKHDAGEPSGFRVRGPYVDITTNAETTGTITITVAYDSGLTNGNEERLKLFHWNGKEWADVTVSVDTVNNLITGKTTGLSTFVVCEAIPASSGGGSGSGSSGGGSGGGSSGTPPQEPSVPKEALFADVASNAWYKEFVSTLISLNIMGGYPDGTFKPNKHISRAEFAKVICLAMGWDLITPETPSFSDVAKDFWAYSYIETARAHGVIGGYTDGTFGPNKNITRAEIAKMVAETLGLPSGTSMSQGANIFSDIGAHWAKGHINACVKAGIVGGYEDSTFRPNGNATRAEAAKMISRMLEDR